MQLLQRTQIYLFICFFSLNINVTGVCFGLVPDMPTHENCKYSVCIDTQYIFEHFKLNRIPLDI